MVYNKGNAMVSRSFRIDKNTLEIIQNYAKDRDLGITVCIRMILESFAENLVADMENTN